MMQPPNSRLRIIVLGFIVRCPSGGLVWHYLQYVKGLAELGHEVYYIEDNCFFESDEYGWCYHPSTNKWDTDPSEGLKFVKDLFAEVGLGDTWAYYDAQLHRWYGPKSENAETLCSTADLLINVSGVNPLRPWLMEIPVRAFIDTDPVFSQVKQLTNETNRNLARQHNRHFTFAENIEFSDCTVPRDSFSWKKTRQPIVMDFWRKTAGRADGKFTTVMVWESYKTLEYAGIRYGMKSDSFKDYFDLPAQVKDALEVAVVCPDEIRTLFISKGWSVADPIAITRTPPCYLDYIQQSKAEFSVAKHTYVITNSGWFSERSAAYLATGRPVVVQETGFSRWLAGGRGVLAFSNIEEAAAAIDEIRTNYELHCDAARDVAEEYFNAKKVMAQLIEDAMTG